MSDSAQFTRPTLVQVERSASGLCDDTGASVIGIDPDVERLAWARFHDGEHAARGTIHRTRKGRPIETYRADLQTFFTEAAESGAVVFVEDVYLAYSPNGQPFVHTFKTLAGVQGELRYIASGVGLDLTFVSPLVWHRSQLPVQNGREAIQAASHRRAAELTGRPVPDPHEADAVCIAAHGCGLCPQNAQESAGPLSVLRVPQRTARGQGGDTTPKTFAPGSSNRCSESNRPVGRVWASRINDLMLGSMVVAPPGGRRPRTAQVQRSRKRQGKT